MAFGATMLNTRNGTWLVLQGNLLQAAVTRLDGICAGAGGGGGTATEEFLLELPGNKGRPEAAAAEHAQQTIQQRDAPSRGSIVLPRLRWKKMKPLKIEGGSSHIFFCQMNSSHLLGNPPPTEAWPRRNTNSAIH
jgi:hypothetical protein